jgi:hypothetical protein
VSESALVLRETSLATGRPETVAQYLAETPGTIAGGPLSGVLHDFAGKLSDLGQKEAAATLWATELSLRCRPASEQQLGIDLEPGAATLNNNSQLASALVTIAGQLSELRFTGSAAMLAAAMHCDRQTVETAKRILAYTPRPKTNRPSPSTLRAITKIAKIFAHRQEWTGASRLGLMIIGLDDGPEMSSIATRLGTSRILPSRREDPLDVARMRNLPPWNRLGYNADEEIFSFFTRCGYPGVAAELSHPAVPRGRKGSARALWRLIEPQLESVIEGYGLVGAPRPVHLRSREPAKVSRWINVWLETTREHLQLVVAVQSARRGGTGMPFQEPDWDDVESIDLLVVVESPLLRFEAACQTAVLPRDGDMDPVRFEIIDGSEVNGACPVQVSFYRASDLHLLEAVSVDIPARQLDRTAGTS